MSVTNDPPDLEKTLSPSVATYFSRVEKLQLRVNEAARALHERGVRPTVARIRAALGGGSPNDLAPALKHWKDSVLPGLQTRGGATTDTVAPLAFPSMIADLAYELWQRATAAAVVELKGGPTARKLAARSEEAQALRNQLSALRDQLQRDALSYGELRAQSARHEAIAKDALNRVRDADTRERDLLRDLGTANQRVAELNATMDQLRSGPDTRRPKPPRQSLRTKQKTPRKKLKRRVVKAHARKANLKSPRPSAMRQSRRPAARRRHARSQ
jgi:hypothetical protein